MNDNFSEAERRGREKCKNDLDNCTCQTYYHFTEDKYDPLDCFVTALTKEMEKIYAVEIKNRNILFTQYENDGFILEVAKYKALMEAYRNSGYTPIYLNYFNDARVSWDVSKLENVENRWITKDCTKTTAENYGNRVPKKVILLYPNEGKVRRYLN